MHTGFATVSRNGRHYHHICGGASAGMVIDLTERWKIAGKASYFGYGAGDGKPEWRFNAQQRLTLTKDLALRFDFAQRQNQREYSLNLHFYF